MLGRINVALDWSYRYTAQRFSFISSSLTLPPVLCAARFPTRRTMASYRRTYLLSNLLRFADNPGFRGRGSAFSPVLVCRHSAGVFLLLSPYSVFARAPVVLGFRARLNWAWRFRRSVLNREPTTSVDAFPRRNKRRARLRGCAQRVGGTDRSRREKGETIY